MHLMGFDPTPTLGSFKPKPSNNHIIFNNSMKYLSYFHNLVGSWAPPGTPPLRHWPQIRLAYLLATPISSFEFIFLENFTSILIKWNKMKTISSRLRRKRKSSHLIWIFIIDLCIIGYRVSCFGYRLKIGL